VQERETTLTHLLIVFADESSACRSAPRSSGAHHIASQPEGSSENGRANWEFAMIHSVRSSGKQSKLPVCSTLAPRFSLFQGVAPRHEDSWENQPRRSEQHEGFF
jgi:hypothetical protein